MWYLLCAAMLASLMTVTGGQGCDKYKKLGADHTMCIYKAKNCPQGIQLVRSGQLTDKQKNAVVKAHNKLRQQIVNGAIRGAPAAKYMNEIVWDDELATIAQRAADQCKFAHDKNRKVERYYVGQNIYIGMRKPIEKNNNPNMTLATQAWFDEIYKPGFPASNINPFRSVEGTGHYTQIAWAKTSAIGCGYTFYIEKGWSKKLIFCNYGPGGNIIGGQMYEVRNN